MNAHILLNLLNQLRKRDKNLMLAKHLYLFSNKYNKLNNTAAQILSSIYHMTINYFEIYILDVKNLDFCINVFCI